MRLTVIVIALVLILTACANEPPSTIAYTELPESGDSARGEQLFTDQGCFQCHVEDATGSPLLDGYSERAGSTVEGQDAREYTFYSITEPWQYVPEEYGNAMPNTYDESMTPADIADLIEYLLGL